MAKPYSQDFRKKVIAAIELEGRKKGEVSEVFHISRNTIDLWLKRKEKTGDLQPKSTKPLSGKDKITDWEKFSAFVNGRRQGRVNTIARAYCDRYTIS